MDVGFSNTNVAAAERDVVSRDLAREDAARVLENFLGRYPSAKISAGATLPDLKQDVPAGLPSELLMRRPDLVAAQAAVYASARRADATRKELLPSFRLTAGGTSASGELTEMLIDPDEIVWNVATSLAQTIYQGGALRADARRALEQNEEQIRNFASLVLTALREVESALAAERSLLKQEYWISQQVQQSNLAEEQAERDYTEGLVGILELLEAQRRAVNGRVSQIVLRNQRLQNRIDLYLALGGDFKTEPEKLEVQSESE